MTTQLSMRVTLSALLLACLVMHGTPAFAQGTSGVRVIVRPILVQAPIYGASIKLPAIPFPPPGGGSGGDNGSAVSGKTDITLEAAYMAGFEIRSDRWFGEVAGTLADVSATRSIPRVVIETNARFYGGRAGVRVIGQLFATGGFERVTTDLSATLTLPTGETIDGKTSPDLWDPFIGAAWRSPLGDRLYVQLAFQGGGFGVGTDVHLVADAVVDWRIVGPLQLRAGWKTLHYKWTAADVAIGAFSRALVSSQTLYGPIVGLGLIF